MRVYSFYLFKTTEEDNGYYSIIHIHTLGLNSPINDRLFYYLLIFFVKMSIKVKNITFCNYWALIKSKMV